MKYIDADKLKEHLDNIIHDAYKNTSSVKKRCGITAASASKTLECMMSAEIQTLGLVKNIIDLMLKEEQPAAESEQANKGIYIDEEEYKKLKRLGILNTSVRSYHVGKSDYSQHVIQPWTIWQDYNLNAWDADIVKRVLRTKEGESRRTDYEKIIHICEERIRQIDNEE